LSAMRRFGLRRMPDCPSWPARRAGAALRQVHERANVEAL